MNKSIRALQVVDDALGLICGVITTTVGYAGMSIVGLVGISVRTAVILMVIGIATVAITVTKLVVLALSSR
jgi:hypothetical protein